MVKVLDSNARDCGFKSCYVLGFRFLVFWARFMLRLRSGSVTHKRTPGNRQKRVLYNIYPWRLVCPSVCRHLKFKSHVGVSKIRCMCYHTVVLTLNLHMYLHLIVSYSMYLSDAQPRICDEIKISEI